MNANSDKDYIDAKTDAVRYGMAGRLDALEANVNGRFVALESNVNGRFVALETKMDAGFAQIRAEFKEAIERATAQMIKWMVGICIAMFTIFFSSMVFFLNNAVPKLQAQPASAVQPIIIQLPPPTAPVVPPQP